MSIKIRRLLSMREGERGWVKFSQGKKGRWGDKRTLEGGCFWRDEKSRMGREIFGVLWERNAWGRSTGRGGDGGGCAQTRESGGSGGVRVGLFLMVLYNRGFWRGRWFFCWGEGVWGAV